MMEAVRFDETFQNGIEDYDFWLSILEWEEEYIVFQKFYFIIGSKNRLEIKNLGGIQNY